MKTQHAIRLPLLVLNSASLILNSSAANTWWLSPSGSDTTGNGSFATPWASMNKIKTAAGSG